MTMCTLIGAQFIKDCVLVKSVTCFVNKPVSC